MRDEKALVWAGHVTTQKMAVFDSYSSRIGEIFFNEIYKSSKQINSQKTSQSILFMCRAKFGTNQLKSLKTPSICFLRYTDISGDFQPRAKLHPSCI
jgi:spore germination protein GerM